MAAVVDAARRREAFGGGEESPATDDDARGPLQRLRETGHERLLRQLREACSASAHSEGHSNGTAPAPGESAAEAEQNALVERLAGQDDETLAETFVTARELAVEEGQDGARARADHWRSVARTALAEALRRPSITEAEAGEEAARRRFGRRRRGALDDLRDACRAAVPGTGDAADGATANGHAAGGDAAHDAARTAAG